MRKHWLTIICLAFFVPAYSQSSLPDVKIRSLTGKELSFSRLTESDTAIIVSLWATWCVPCILELETISDQYKERQNATPFKLIAVSVDDARTASRVKPFVSGRGWPFEIYLDVNNDLKRALNVNDIPHVLIIRNGKIVHQRNGYVPGSENELFSYLGKNENEKTNGQLHGSFETYTQFYREDDKINAILPADRLGSNNFLKLDYNYKQFTAGIQFEAYLPSIAGFPFVINQGKLVNRYFRYSAKNFSVQAGDFYEQFGSGLVFRSWENRQIGINNALEGVNIQVKPLRFLSIKALYGRQRKVFEYANSNVRGIDAEIDLTASATAEAKQNTKVLLGGSFVSRYQQYTGPDPDFPATVKAGAIRLNISGQTASLSLEYVHKGKDPHDVNGFDTTTGKALLLNGSFTKNNLGISVTFRGMKNMDFRGERDAFGTQLPVNFIPALTKQHDYLTTNIFVYNAQAMGETGGQFEFFYNFSEGSGLGGRHGSKIAFNFSYYGRLGNGNTIFSPGGEKFFQDMSIEWKKKWSEKWSSILSYHHVFYNKSVVEGGIYDNIRSHIGVLNTIYRYKANKAFRFELQHLATEQDAGNWAAAVSELSFAPLWTFYLSDLYNYGATDTHYPVIGGIFTKGGTRFGLSYGRQRAGLFCVGGVCRFVPAASGFTATLTVTF